MYVYVVVIVPVVTSAIDYVFFQKNIFPASHSAIFAFLNILFVGALILYEIVKGNPAHSEFLDSKGKAVSDFDKLAFMKALFWILNGSFFFIA